MIKFTIVDIGGNKRDIPYLIKELRHNNLITGTEKDAGWDTLYITNNIVGVKRVMEDYDGLMLDIVREK